MAVGSRHLAASTLIDSSQSPDALLIAAAQQGDPAALEELIGRYYRRIRDLCVRSVADRAQAEDITQEVFLRAFSHLAQIDSAREILPWLATIARRLCIDQLRKQGRRTTCEINDAVDLTTSDASDATLEAVVSRDELRHLNSRLVQALGRLKRRDRRFLVLRLVEGWSYERIADEDATSVATVRNAVWRARRSLQSQLQGTKRRWDLRALSPGLLESWRRLKSRVRTRIQGLPNLAAESTLAGSEITALTNWVGVIAVSVFGWLAPDLSLIANHAPLDSAVSQNFTPAAWPPAEDLRAATPEILLPAGSGRAKADLGPTHHVAPSSGKLRLEIVGPDGKVIYGQQTEVDCRDQGAALLPQDGSVRAAC